MSRSWRRPRCSRDMTVPIGRLHDLGDLLVGEALDVGEVDREPELLGQPLEGVLDLGVGQVLERLHLGGLQAGRGVRLGAGELPVLDVLGHRLLRLALLLAVGVDEGVGQDPVEPGLEVGAGPELVEGASTPSRRSPAPGPRRRRGCGSSASPPSRAGRGRAARRARNGRSARRRSRSRGRRPRRRRRCSGSQSSSSQPTRDPPGGTCPSSGEHDGVERRAAASHSRRRGPSAGAGDLAHDPLQGRLHHDGHRLVLGQVAARRHLEPVVGARDDGAGRRRRGTPRAGPSGPARPGPPGSAPRRPRSSSSRDFSGRPGRVQREGERQAAARRRARGRSGRRSGPRRSGRRRPAGCARAAVSAAATSASSRVGRRGRDRAPGDPPRLLEPDHRDARGGAGRAASASRSRVSMPPPAPWLSSSVATGRRARSVTSRASPCGVATRRSLLMRSAARAPGPSSSGSGSTSSGPLLRTLLTSVETGIGLEAARGGRAPAGRAGRPVVGWSGSSHCVPALGLDHQRHPVVDVAERRPRPRW